MFATILCRTDFVFLVMLFSLKINSSFLLMLSLHLSHLFFLLLMRSILLLRGLSLDLFIHDNVQLCRFLNLTRHLSLLKLFLL